MAIGSMKRWRMSNSVKEKLKDNLIIKKMAAKQINYIKGQELKKIRISKNLTITKVAKDIGVSESSLSYIENGKTTKGNIISLLYKYYNIDKKEEVKTNDSLYFALSFIDGKKISESLWNDIKKEMGNTYEIKHHKNNLTSVKRVLSENGIQMFNEKKITFYINKLSEDTIKDVNQLEQLVMNNNPDEFNKFNYGMTRINIEHNTNEKTESVNHPSHYGGANNPYEAIKVIRAWHLGFNLGNTIKYISRAGKKDKTKTIEDLEKALWYLQDEINHLKKQIK